MREPAVVDVGGYTPERIEVRVRGLSPGRYVLRYVVEIAGSEGNIRLQRPVIVR